MLSLNELARRALAQFEVPGVAVAIVKDGEIIAAEGFGQRSLGAPDPVDAHSLFGIASISKTFTATALAMLVDEGRLAWDDPVSRYLPDFQLADPFASRELRVRDLLIHNSGLGEVSGGTVWYGSDLSRAEVVRRLRYLPPAASFRSRFAYQNVTFLVAGQIVQAITGQSWDQVVCERIFQPLGMTRSTTSVPALLERDNVAQPHARIRAAVRPVPIRSHDNVGPAASINTSAIELAQYALLHLGRGATAGRQLFSEQRSAELWSAQTAIPIEPPHPALQRLQPRFYAYGLGWYLRDYRSRKVVSHSGGVDGYRTLLTLVPEENLGVIVLSNQETAITHAITYTLLDDVFGAPPFDWVAAYTAAAAEGRQTEEARQRQQAAERVSNTRPSLPLEGYAGAYADPLVDAVSVALEDNRLTLRFQHTPAFTA
ncbi:MAG TPA: serine hydrolase, partial [Anaerolineaceae bacterium]|nr:serine hydrolase [Anaerolineaceae bacterium]